MVLDSHSRGISFSTEVTRSRIWSLERNLLIGNYDGWAALKIGDRMLRWVNHYRNLVVRAESAFPPIPTELRTSRDVRCVP